MFDFERWYRFVDFVSANDPSMVEDPDNANLACRCSKSLRVEKTSSLSLRAAKERLRSASCFWALRSGYVACRAFVEFVMCSFKYPNACPTNGVPGPQTGRPDRRHPIELQPVNPEAISGWAVMIEIGASPGFCGIHGIDPTVSQTSDTQDEI